jgi:hypothetical protein
MAVRAGLEGAEQPCMKGIMGTELLRQRAKTLRGRLLTRALEAHSLYTRSFGDDSFDPVELQTWHHNFPVHTLDVEPNVALKPKPELEPQSTVSDFLRDNDIKQQLLDAAMKSAPAHASKESGSSSGILSAGLLSKVPLGADC